MRPLTRRIAVLAAGLACAAGGARAQAPVRFGVGGGGTFLGGEINDLAGSGVHGMGTMQVRLWRFPFQTRLDLFYNVLGKTSFQFTDDGMLFDAERRMRVIGGTLSAVVEAPGSSVRPYLLAGVGYYHTRTEIVATSETLEFGDEERATKPGVQGGAGLLLRAGGASVFIEGRVHYVFDGLDAPGNTQTGSVQLFPVTIGIVFGGAARTRPGERP